MRTPILLSLLCLVLAACAKPLPPERAAYVGEWRGDHMAMRISADGRVEYKREDGGNTTSIDAPLKEFSGDDFIVGVGPMSTTFKVSVAPHEAGGEWKMTVDGVELTRAPAAE